MPGGFHAQWQLLSQGTTWICGNVSMGNPEDVGPAEILPGLLT